MRFTVLWLRSAEDELVDLWLNAWNRNSVSASANKIDQQLADDAPNKGEEISEGLRAFAAPPLRVLFTVQEDDRIVEVLQVKRM